MARVISWRIDNKFVYIEDRNQHPQCIYDTQWDNERIRAHGKEVLLWTEPVYEANFNYMYEKVAERWGTATDLRSNYEFYYNSNKEDGVYMLSGIDGANIADYGKPFYNLVIENANTSLGLGGDYTLDVDATVKTWIYLERNGTVYLPDEVSVKYGSETVVSRTYNEPGRTRVEIDIPCGTMFTNNERNREYEITVKKNGFEGRVLFTVVGVKDGEEGMSYDLLVHPKQIKVSSDGEISNYSVTCKILKNGVEVPQESGRFEIRYTFGIPTTDYDDVGNVYSDPISYNMLSENGDQVNFYLYVNGRIVDTDSCIVSRDGIDGGFMKLELDNEIDAVGVGTDSKLDVTDGVRFSTGMILYSAGTELTITRILVDDGYGNHEITSSTYDNGKAHYSASELNTKYATFHTLLDNEYEFGVDLRNSVKITAYGTNDVGQQSSASTNYIIIGIQGAEDGVTYKLMPSADYILYDPNTRLVKWGAHDAVSVDNISGEKFSVYPLENGRQKTSAEVSADQEFISYSIGVTYSTAEMADAATKMSGNLEFSLSELFTEEITTENATAKFVTFYWCKRISGHLLMIDRETVPVIIQGINGNSIWVELGNEIDAVGVGEDTDLDIEEDVTIGTTVRIISGGTPIRISSIEVIKPRGTESNWDDYAESTTGFTGNDHATPDNGTHTIGYVSITLKNGFEFGPDYREAPTIRATSEDGWSGFTQYIIKGIANGKDGYVYRLMPEVDYVTFNPNAGHDGTLDENEVSCRAYYGKYELGEEGFTNGTIYYSVNCIYDSIPDVIPDTSMSGNYVTGFTEYTSSVSLDEILSKNNYWNFKYIAFYLVIDSDMPDGTVVRELVDRETVKIISDGLDAQGNVTIELTNEIDSIGLGGDTKLDLPAGESRTLSTGVRLFSGGTKMLITKISASFVAGSNAGADKYSFPDPLYPSTAEEDAVVYVNLFNGFDFGDDYKEKVLITAKGQTEKEVYDVETGSYNTMTVTGSSSAIFVIAGVKSGKDGQTYKVQPTPDYAFFDLQIGEFIGDNNISAWAYSNGKLMSGSSTYNTDYQIKYTNNVLYDLETAEQNWGSTVFKAYQPEGNNLHFDAPSGSSGREQAKVFYLAVSSDGGAHWTVVDRESVPLFINGKEGKDGVGAVRFDMTNPFEVINTGEDLTLDSSSWKPYSTVVYGYEGTEKVKITCTSKPSDTSTMKVSAVTASDGFGVTVTVYLRNYTFDSTTQKLSVPLSFWFNDDHSKSGSLTYTLVAIMNGKGAEGDAYRLRTNVSRITTNATSFSPETLLAGVYLGNTLVPATIYAKYKPEGEYLSTLEQMDTRSYDTYSSYTSNALSTTITKAAGANAKNKNGTLYIAAFDGTSVNAQFLDADDIPIQVDYDEGSASGILADLSDDVGVVGVGDNEKLEANVIGKLTTIGYIFKGRPPMKLSSVELPNNGNAITEHGGRIQFVLRNFTAGVSTSAEIAVNINASEDDYVDFRGNNPLQFNIVLHGAVEEGEEAVERTVGYSILGLKDGKDGETVHLELNADKIYHNQDTGFSPQDVRCRLYYCGEDITSESAGGNNATLRFMIKNSDWADEQGTELFWLYNGHYDSTAGDYVFSISDQEFSEYDPICIRAERKTGNSGTDADWTLLDWETVQVLRDGKDGIGGIELKFDNSPAYVTQVDGSKVVTEDVTATTYATLYSGSTTVKLNSLTLLPDESEYDSSKVHFRSECPANGSAYVEVGIDEGFSFASLSPIMLRIEGTGTDPDTNEPVVRRATFSIYDAAGGKGERGPKTRIRYWSDATELDYQNGSDDDEFWDIVYYVSEDGEFGGYFGCKTDQDKNTEKVPPKVVNGEWDETDENWVYYPDYDFVATKVISVGEWPDGWVIDQGKIQHTSSSITLNGHTAAIEVKEGAPIIYSYKNGNTILYTKQDFHNQQEFDSNVDGYVSVYRDSECAGSPVTSTYVLRGTSGNPKIVLPSTVVNIPMVLHFDGVRFWLTRNTNLNVPIDYDITFRLYKSEKIRYTYSDSSVVFCSVHGYTDYKVSGTMPAGSLSSGKVSVVLNSMQVYDADTSNSLYTSEADVNSNVWDPRFGFHPQVITLGSGAKSSGIRLGSQKEYAINEDWGGEGSGGGGTVVPPPVIIEDEDDPGETPVTIREELTIYSYLYYRVTGMILDGGGANVYVSSVSDEQTGTNRYRKSNEVSSNGSISGENEIATGSDIQTNETVYDYQTQSQGNTNPLAALINGNVNTSSDYGDIVIAAGIENGGATLYKWTASNTTDQIYTFTNLSEISNSGETQAYMGFEKPYEIVVKKKDSDTIVYNGKEFDRSTTTVTVSNLSRFAVSRLYKDGTLVTSKLYATDGSFDGKVNAKYGNFTGSLIADHCNISDAYISDSKFSGSIDLPSNETLIAYNSANLPYFTILDGAVNEGFNRFGTTPFYREDSGSWLGLGGKTYTGQIHEFLTEAQVSGGGTSIKVPTFNFRVSGAKIKEVSATLTIIQDTRPNATTLKTVNLVPSSGETGCSYSWTGDTFTANSSAPLKITMTYSFSIGGGKGRISMLGDFSGPIEVGRSNTTASYIFGSNGAYLTDGKSVVSLNRASGITLSVGYNAIKITNGDIVLETTRTVGTGTSQTTTKYSMSLRDLLVKNIGNTTGYMIKTAVNNEGTI